MGAIQARSGRLVWLIDHFFNFLQIFCKQEYCRSWHNKSWKFYGASQFILDSYDHSLGVLIHKDCEWMGFQWLWFFLLHPPTCTILFHMLACHRHWWACDEFPPVTDFRQAAEPPVICFTIIALHSCSSMGYVATDAVYHLHKYGYIFFDSRIWQLLRHYFIVHIYWNM